MESIERLQQWYKNHCNGDWEHNFGIKIDTLDNPGWLLTIDLQLTPLQDIDRFEDAEDKSALDWYQIKVGDWKYKAYGDPSKLNFLIDYFLDRVATQVGNTEFEYEILVPLYGAPINVWTTGYAKLNHNNQFELIRIDALTLKTMLSSTLDNEDNWMDCFNSLKLKNNIGDIVETELVETFQGIALAVK